MILERVDTGSEEATIAQVINASSDGFVFGCVGVVGQRLWRYDFYEQVDDYLLRCIWKGEAYWSRLEKIALLLGWFVCKVS